MKKVFLIVLSIILLMSPVVNAAFSDVASEHWAASYINELTATVENGKRDEIGEAATIPLVRKKGEISQILLKEEEKATVQIIRNKLEAPVEKNQEAGVLIYYINNEKWMEESLVCKENVGKIDYKWCLKRIVTKILN